jgi:pimeloyl-ACP methyl ester carboxylesterase
MRRGWKILIGVVVVLAVLLALNTIAVDHETKSAEVTVDGGRILDLPGGDVQVLDEGPRTAPTIVLLHCYTCAIDWWDGVIPLLRRTHRVVAIDLLGHGGSEKPGSGYSMEEQAALVAQALNRLGVRRATVVGHSLGGTVATALVEQSPDLVSGLVIIDQAPDSSYGNLNLLAQVGYLPVIGEAFWRTAPDFAVKDGLGQAFAPGYDVPDRFVDDFRRMTFTSYDDSAGAEDDYTDEKPLDERLRPSGVRLLVIFGSEDQIYDERKALSAYASIPGAQTELIQGPGHSPNVEKPAKTAQLILRFAKQTPAAPSGGPPGKHPSDGRGETASAAPPAQFVARCDKAIIGPGRPNWRKRSIVAGRFGLARGDFGTAQVVNGILVAKRMALVAGREKVVLRVPAAERSRVRLNYGLLRNLDSFGDGPVQITFAPCPDKPRTVWPGGLMLQDRRPVKLEVVGGGKTTVIRVH